MGEHDNLIDVSIGDDKPQQQQQQQHIPPPQNYPPQGYEYPQQQQPPQPYPPQYANNQPSHYSQPPQYPNQPPQYPPQYPSNEYPPQQGYGYPQQNDAVIVGVAPTPQVDLVSEEFGEQLRKLPGRFVQAVIKPYVANYEDLKRFASWPMVFALLFVSMIWSIIMVAINVAIYNASVRRACSMTYYDSDVCLLERSMGGAIGYDILSTIIWFFLVNGVFHLVALCLGGGRGMLTTPTSSSMFLQLCFLSLLFSVPLSFASILTLIPYLGWVIWVAIAIYRFVLFVITLQSVYNLTACHAIGIIVVFGIVFGLIVIIIYATAATAVVGTLLLLMK